MASIEEYKQAIKTLQNIQEGAKIDRFKFTATEANAIGFAVDYMKASLEEEKEEK
jgi:hypothetical protein